MIYIAGPYHHSNQYVREYRYRMHRDYLMQLMKKGETAYSPIALGHTLLPELNDWTGDRWLLWDLPILRLCSEVHVLMLPGWEQSKGTQHEVALAKDLNLPIHHVEWA